MPLIDFKLSLLSGQYDVNKTEEKRAYIAAALKVIAEAESASVKEDLLKIVRDKTGTTYEALKRDLENAPAQPRSETRIERKLDDGSDRVVKACRFILASVLFHGEICEEFRHFECQF